MLSRHRGPATAGLGLHRDVFFHRMCRTINAYVLPLVLSMFSKLVVLRADDTFITVFCVLNKVFHTTEYDRRLLNDEQIIYHQLKTRLKSVSREYFISAVSCTKVTWNPIYIFQFARRSPIEHARQTSGRRYSYGFVCDITDLYYHFHGCAPLTVGTLQENKHW